MSSSVRVPRSSQVPCCSTVAPEALRSRHRWGGNKEAVIRTVALPARSVRRWGSGLLPVVLGLLVWGVGPVGAASQDVERGAIVSVELIGRLTASEIGERLAEEGIPGVPVYDVALYRIVYHTVDPQGRGTRASGALAIPQGLTRPAPLLSYQHGTTVARHRVASVRGFDPVSMGLGTSGYVTALPDFLGLGDSSGLHPYIHAASLGTSVVDFLRASRQWCDEQDVALNGQVFLMGYSEGGYATMAVHRDMEAAYADEFTVTASAPMAGPYNLSEVMVNQILETTAYPSPMYLPFTILAYNEVYGLFSDLSTVFVPSYVERLCRLFDGTRSMRAINEELPPVPRDILQPSFIEAFESDANHPLRQALRENDLYDWAPRAPMRLHHCRDDDQVPHKNAETALSAFKAHGAVQVELNTLEFGNHQECAAPSLFLGKLWFDSFLDEGAATPTASTRSSGVDVKGDSQ